MSLLTWPGLSQPYGICSDGTYLFVTNNGSSSVSRYRLSDGSYNNSFIPSVGYAVATDKTYVYVTPTAASASPTIINRYTLDGVAAGNPWATMNVPNVTTSMAADSGNLYVNISGGLYSINLQTPTIQNLIYSRTAPGPTHLSTYAYNGNVYVPASGVAGSPNQDFIVAINTTTLVATSTQQWNGIWFDFNGIAMDNYYMYYTSWQGHSIGQYLLTGGGGNSNVFSTNIGTLNRPEGIVLVNGNAYITCYGSNSVYTNRLVASPPTITSALVPTNTSSISISFTAGTGGVEALYGYAYSVNGGQSISPVVAQTASPLVISGLSYGGNYNVGLYSASRGAKSTAISNIVNVIIPYYPCFKKGTRICTDKGYVRIEQLHPGDLVKTLKHGFQPVVRVGKREMTHSSSESRVPEQLYVCDPETYPDLFRPLVLTGCHSILVSEFPSEEAREQTRQVNGHTYVTDGLWRLPACADPKTRVYGNPGDYTVYHVALKHANPDMNYGIYANGLLVESCSENHMNERF